MPLLAALAALALVSPGAPIIRSNAGTLIPVLGDSPRPLLWLPFITPGDYPSGTTVLSEPQGTPLTITRSSTAYRTNGSALVLTAANQLRVEPDGAVIEGYTTNVVKYSGDVCNGAAWQAMGGQGHTCSNDAGGTAPDGAGTWDRLTTTGDDAAYPWYQGQTSVSFRGTATASAYFKAPSGTVLAKINFYGDQCTGSEVSCFTSDGSACSATFVAAGTYEATATVGTTPVRLSVAGGACTLATGTSQVSVGSPTLNGVVDVWGVQLEPASAGAPTSYIATTTTATVRQADVVYVASPVGGQAPGATKFCITSDVKPNSGGAWGPTAYSRYLASSPTYTAIEMNLRAFDTGLPGAQGTDGGPRRRGFWPTDPLTPGAHRVAFCWDGAAVNTGTAGAYGVWRFFDGSVEAAGSNTADSAGALLGTWHANLYVGGYSPSSVNMINGRLKDFRFCSTRCP